MSGLKPLLIVNAVEQQGGLFGNFQHNGFHSFTTDTYGSRANFSGSEDNYSPTSYSPLSSSFAFRLPIVSSLPAIDTASVNNSISRIHQLWPEFRRDSHTTPYIPSRYEGTRSKSCVSIGLERCSLDFRAIDRRAMQLVQSQAIQSTIKSNTWNNNQTTLSCPDFTPPPPKTPSLKLDQDNIFSALCIIDPTALSHPIKMQTLSYKLTNLGLLHIGNTQDHPSDAWHISQELSLDSRPKFILEWTGILHSFIPGRAKLLLGAQIDITSTMRTMAEQDLSSTTPSSKPRTRSLASTAHDHASASTPLLPAFTHLFEDTKRQFRRYFVLQLKPRSRLPLRSPTSSRFPSSPTSPALPVRSPSATYPDLTAYAITFASPAIHACAADVLTNFNYNARGDLERLARRLGGKERFEMAVRWGAGREVLWLTGVPMEEGAGRWWVCWLGEGDDEIF